MRKKTPQVTKNLSKWGKSPRVNCKSTASVLWTSLVQQFVFLKKYHKPWLSEDTSKSCSPTSARPFLSDSSFIHLCWVLAHPQLLLPPQHIDSASYLDFWEMDFLPFRNEWMNIFLFQFPTSLKQTKLFSPSIPLAPWDPFPVISNKLRWPSF